MIRGLTHVVSIKVLSSLSCIVVGRGMQVFRVENDIFGWACLKANCFQEKGRNKPERELKCETPQRKEVLN